MPAKIKIHGNTKDLTGKQFGRLVASKPTSKKTNDRCVIWQCRCNCGKIVYVSSSKLLCGRKKSCGCLYKETAPKNGMSNFEDITGRRFGRLIALEPTTKENSKCVVWKCLCDCGNITFVRGGHLRRGNTKSCGCLRDAHRFVVWTPIDPMDVPFAITDIMKTRREIKKFSKQAS